MGTVERVTEPAPVDETLSQVVHQLFAANLDLQSVLGVFSRHQGPGRDRVHAVIDRLDDTIAALHHAGARLQISLADQAVLNQARGVLAARLGISVAEAAALIADHAARHALDVTAVARAVVAGEQVFAAG